MIEAMRLELTRTPPDGLCLTGYPEQESEPIFTLAFPRRPGVTAEVEARIQLGELALQLIKLGSDGEIIDESSDDMPWDEGGVYSPAS